MTSHDGTGVPPFQRSVVPPSPDTPSSLITLIRGLAPEIGPPNIWALFSRNATGILERRGVGGSLITLFKGQTPVGMGEPLNFRGGGGILNGYWTQE